MDVPIPQEQMLVWPADHFRAVEVGEDHSYSSADQAFGRAVDSVSNEVVLGFGSFEPAAVLQVHDEQPFDDPYVVVGSVVGCDSVEPEPGRSAAVDVRISERMKYR